MPVKSYRELIAWQKAMDYVILVYRATANFPREELYGLVSQLRRAVVSIPSNIAEGRGRQSTRELLNFLSIAYGSLNESQTQVLIAERLNYLDGQQAAQLLEASHEVGRLI
jgi:four helix bundle protein